jgi:hypothetical protein
MSHGGANGASADGVGSFDCIHFLLDDRQEAQGQKDGKGKTIRHAKPHKSGH